MRVRRCRLRSGLTGSARVIGCPFIADLLCWRAGAVPWPGRGARAVREAAVTAAARGGGRCRCRPQPRVRARGRRRRAGAASSLPAGTAGLLVRMSCSRRDGLVLLGAFAVQGGLVAGELVAQRGDGVVRGGQLRGGGGEGGVVPLLVLLAGAGSIRAGCPGCGQGGVTLGAGGGDGLFCFGDPGCGCPAFVVQRRPASRARCSACRRAAASASIAVMAWAAAARASAASSLGGVPGGRLAGGLGAGLLQPGRRSRRGPPRPALRRPRGRRPRPAGRRGRRAGPARRTAARPACSSRRARRRGWPRPG